MSVFRREVVAAGQRRPQHHQHRVRRPREVYLHGVQRLRHLQLHRDTAGGLHQRRHGCVLHGGLPGHLHHHHGPERHAAVHDEQPSEENRESHQRVFPNRGRREAAEGVRDRQTHPDHNVGQNFGAGEGDSV